MYQVLRGKYGVTSIKYQITRIKLQVSGSKYLAESIMYQISERKEAPRSQYLVTLIK